MVDAPPISITQAAVELSGLLTPTPADVEQAKQKGYRIEADVERAIKDGIQLNDKDRLHLQLPDSEYVLQTWDHLKEVISKNRIQDLKRVPSDLKRYQIWSEDIKKEYGSIVTFILKERLGWTDLTPVDPEPFKNPEDHKILINDWPYGNVPGILHLVVWTKCKIPTQPPLGDLTPEARTVIDRYIRETFTSKLGEENVQWFKNWASIQSVRSVDHVHVLLRRVPEDVLAGWVGAEAGRAAFVKYRLDVEA